MPIRIVATRRFEIVYRSFFTHKEVHAAVLAKMKMADSEPGIIPNSLHITAL